MAMLQFQLGRTNPDPCVDVRMNTPRWQVKIELDYEAQKGIEDTDNTTIRVYDREVAYGGEKERDLDVTPKFLAMINSKHDAQRSRLATTDDLTDLLIAIRELGDGALPE